MRSSSKRSLTLTVSLAAVVLIFGLFLAGMREAGFLNLTSNTPPKEVLAAAVALVGGWIASAVSVIGLILKHSADERIATLQEQAEERLKLESGLRAATLFTTTEGKPAPPIQRAVALYALAGLRQHDLAVDLVFGLLDSGALDAVTAGGVLERVFLSDDLPAKRDAISRLGSRAEKMVIPEGVALPPSLSVNPRGFEPYVRRRLPDLFGRVLLSQPFGYWKGDFEQVGMIIGALCVLWLDDKDKRIRQDAGIVLHYALGIVPDTRPWLPHPAKREPIKLDQVGESVKYVSSKGSSVSESIGGRLRHWAPSGDGDIVAERLGFSAPPYH